MIDSPPPAPRPLPRGLRAGLGAALVLAGACGPRTRPAADAPAAQAGARGAAPPAGGAPASRLLLTGELDAVSSANLVVPRTSQWQIQLRWLAEPGAQVKAGERVAEFDTSAFLAELNEKKLAALVAASDLLQQHADNAIRIAEQTFEVQRARSALVRARLQALIPPDTLPARVFQENQLEVERKRLALEAARDRLAADRRTARLDLQIRSLALEKARREIRAARRAIGDLVLLAPRAGVVVIGDHPWENRKLEVGDTIWVGVPVVRLPDLATMRVRAMLSDVDEGRVTAGMKATCTVDAYPDRPLPGVVREVSPVAREPGQRSLRRAFAVLVDVEQVDREHMMPGLSVKVEIATAAAPGTP